MSTLADCPAHLDPNSATGCSQSADPRTEEAVRWIHRYLMAPHPEIGRPGAVCPFVEPAVKAGTLRIESWPEVTKDTLGSVVDRMVELFRNTAWPARNANLRAVVVVLPGLNDEDAFLLDDLQAAAKVRLAEQGFMLGQFHPRCEEPAARNAAFPVSRSPVPLLALRSMSFHDVLFVHDEEVRFGTYRDRYGSRYERGGKGDSIFAELYRRAVELYGLSEE